MGGVGSGYRARQYDKIIDPKTKAALWAGLRKKIIEGDVQALLEHSVRLQDAYLSGKITGSQLRSCMTVIAVQRTIMGPVDMNRRTRKLEALEGFISRPKSKLELRDVGPPPDSMTMDIP